ncbi:hypothetical protein BH23BAC4_BH23BAC4_11490 [soil metagenome]
MIDAEPLGDGFQGRIAAHDQVYGVGLELGTVVTKGTGFPHRKDLRLPVNKTEGIPRGVNLTTTLGGRMGRVSRGRQPRPEPGPVRGLEVDGGEVSEGRVTAPRVVPPLDVPKDLHPAVYLGTEEWGTIAEGKAADLILLEANPLEEIGNAARRAGVMVRGHWLPESEIQARLDVIETSLRD